MGLKVSINGQLVDKEQAKISVFDNGVLYGDGIFEGLRSYGGKVFRLREHLDRLWDSAKAIWLEIPITKEALAQTVNDTLAVNGIQDGYVRITVTRGIGNISFDPSKAHDVQVIVITDFISVYPEETYRRGLDIITSSVIRNHSAALNPRIKSLNYLNNVLAKIEALRAGCSEALMLNQNGEVAEATGANLFIVRRGELLTPPLNAGILEGITRQAVIELAREAGMSVREMALTKYDVYVAEECFLTGSAAEIIPVVKLDSRAIGSGQPGPVTADLRERFFKLVRSS